MNRIKELRMQHRYTQDELGQLLGIQKAAICKYETGRAEPPPKTLIRLSDLFEVSIDYLLGREQDGRLANAELINVPILGRVHAGLPILAEENIADYVPLSQHSVQGGEYFFMEVVGDCMVDAHIVEGALVLVRVQPHVENGQIAVVQIDDEVVLRKVKWLQNQLFLYPANTQYEPMLVASGDVHIIGRVVEVRIRGL